MLDHSAPDYKPLLNRETRQQLRRDGLEEVIDGLADIRSIQRLALWCKKPGGLVNLFSLLSVASRLTAAHYFSSLKLISGPDRLAVKGQQKPLPSLDACCADFLENYPRDDFSAAWREEQNEIRVRLITELFLLKTLRNNPATGPFQNLFDDGAFNRQTDYLALLDEVDAFCIHCRDAASGEASLSRLLRGPIDACPDSLAEQVAYIQRHWSAWLPTSLLQELDVAQAIYAEETATRLAGPGPQQQPVFGHGDGSDAPAAFTADTDWMSSAVMLAKSVYVWLDQLSSRYQKKISSLAEIPEEELALLSRQGFNALWLIGIWERSRASRTIKQICGNPEAEASAYSLYAYRVAEELGGEPALAVLEERCGRHGIRLACDVVPNHTGIDSEWMLQHPEWFIQAEQPPYPAYRFTGPDLCNADDISIRIEDGYWNHSDAAVVCEYHEHLSGRRRYIYHGNDGTHMPWNDTAQLNFLLPEVRRAMSDLIVAVARRFRLIRFDAAMTLARKHYRRLWFPPPGGSAGVPSRSAAWMTDEDFNRAFPVEFWREIVDRINREVPDTLLIAEAFWLMESYFVRNLGMHRVYNSAFMNMLKREENAKYRQILKDILAYNPEILKRYVNFMNNPDEATAVEQFGKGDKYFGVATLLATLPGLPMFGHGQVEGYREKYGMEYRRAYWQEQPDEGFMTHHERQIFPLLRKRADFAGVDNFSMYDFSTAGGVNENVFAFSNGPSGHKSLVVYNNAPHATRGRIHWAAAKAAPGEEGEAREMQPFWQELGMEFGNAGFCRYRDLQMNEYLTPVAELQAGLELQLDGYAHLVFSDFRLLVDEDGLWHDIHCRLQGSATTSLDRLKQEQQFKELWSVALPTLDLERLHVLAGALTASPLTSPIVSLVEELSKDLDRLADELAAVRGKNEARPTMTELAKVLEVVSQRLAQLSAAGTPLSLLTKFWHGQRDKAGLGVPVLAWLLLHLLGCRPGQDDDQDCADLLRSVGLDYAWQQQAVGRDQQQAVYLSLLLLEEDSQEAALDDESFARLCRRPANRGLLGINQHGGVNWFNREGMASLAGAVALRAVLESPDESADKDLFVPVAEKLRDRLARAAAVGYRLDKFLLLG